MKATITIHMDNAAFGDAPSHELVRILREYADKHEYVAADDLNTPLRDFNGNTVGRVVIED